VPKSLRSAAVYGQPGQFHPWLAKEAVDAQKSQRKQTLKTRMVAAPEGAAAAYINALAYPTAPESPGARKSKFPELPNNQARAPP
jgi:hypothetical protein